MTCIAFVRRTLTISLLAQLALYASAYVGAVRSQDLAASARLCGDDDSSSIRLLIGSFQSDGGELAVQNGKMIAYSLALALEDRPDLRVLVWDPNSSQVRENGRVMELLSVLADQGKLQTSVPDGVEKQRSRYAEELRNFLKGNKCDLAVSGRVAQTGQITTVSAVLVTSRTSQDAFIFELGSIVDSTARAPIRNSGHELAERLAQKISDVLPRPMFVNEIAIGCLSIDDFKGNQPLDQFAARVRQQIGQELSYDGRFKGQVTAKGPVVCGKNYPTQADSGVRALIGAAIRTKSDGFFVRPMIRLHIPDGASAIEISLKETGPYSYDREVGGRFTADIRKFLTATTDSAGKFPTNPVPLRRASPPDLVGATMDLVQLGAHEVAAILSYYSLSKYPDDPAANLALGYVLTAKRMPRLALEFLNRARVSQNNISDVQKKLLWEALSDTWLEVNVADADLTELRNYYNKDARKASSDQTRSLTRNIALLLAKQGRSKEAYQFLIERTDLHNTPDILALLGKLSALENSEESINWFKKASTLAPNDSDIKHRLAEVYARRGNQYLDQADLMNARNNKMTSRNNKKLKQLYADAKYNFEMSLNTAPETSSPELHYLAAYSSFKKEDFETAAAWYEKVVSAREFRWAESSWLGLVESLLLSDHYTEADKRAQDAINVLLRTAPDSHLAALYMRFAARVLQSPNRSLDEFRNDEVYAELQKLQKYSSISNLRWDSSLVLKFLAEKRLPDAASSALGEVIKVFNSNREQRQGQNANKTP
jgi:hypothetical protein